jgi:WD40 repeat protein
LTFPAKNPFKLLQASPDGEWFAVLGDQAIELFRHEKTHFANSSLKNDTRSGFTHMAFHPSGRYLGVTSSDGTAKFYDTTNWKVAKTYDWKIGKPRCIAFSADGLMAAVGGDQGKIVVWDMDV